MAEANLFDTGGVIFDGDNVPYDNDDNPQKPPGAGDRFQRSRRYSMDNKRRRSSLLGNLMAHGRLSRGLSIAHLTRHLTQTQREDYKKARDGGMPPIAEDYYFVEDIDSEKVFIEKPEQLPGAMPPTLTTFQDIVTSMQAQPEQDPSKSPPISPPPPPSEPEMEETEGEDEGGEPIVFPVQRNTVEMQSKLIVVRNLRTYQQHNKVVHGKCYYVEDEIDLTFLKAKPLSFVIFGKPGVGKTTLGMKLAEKLHAIHLNPENIIEYFRGPREPIRTVKVNEMLENGETIPDSVMIELIDKRIKEFDVLHRGYVLEGFPLVTSDDLAVDIQLEALEKIALPPEYLIILHMQDKDLYKRRCQQMYDPETGKVYTKQQYSNFDPDWMIFNRKAENPYVGLNNMSNEAVRQNYSKALSDAPSSENPITEEASDTEKRTAEANSDVRAVTPEDILNVNEIDFPKMPHDVLNRLVFRTEDFNIIVNDDLESFRFNFSELQHFVQNFDKRKTLEVDAYWSPTVIFRRVWEWCEAIGLQPIPVPVQIVRPMSMNFLKRMSEMAGEDDDEDNESDDDDEDDDERDESEEEEEEQGNDTTEAICEEEPPIEIDWTSATRAVCVRGLVDPRFRWRLSRWDHLCPVALKLGRSTQGKPEIAVSFMDKVFFMSSKHAAEQFINNPRPYLLPKMPTSPIKFLVIGHPLAGKTTFAKELAVLTDATVIDMDREIVKRFNTVKRDYIWKKRLKYVLEASNTVNRENEMRWQRQERSRRKDMHAWVENHLKALAEAEIVAMLERDRELLHKIRTELRLQSEHHAIGEVYKGDGACQPDDGKIRFNWKKFVRDAISGKRVWTHQEMLELAWDLFHQRRLYYKRKQQETLMRRLKDLSSSETDEEMEGRSREGSGSESEEGDDESENEDEDDESLGFSEEESDDSSSHRRKKKKKKPKKKCVRIELQPVKSEDIVEPFIFESFDVDPDDREPEESIRIRFPMIPFELVDIVPPPPMVGEKDLVVHMIVEEKLAKDEIHVDAMPPEIFVEILRRAVAEVETRYRMRNKNMAMTGGWIIDNFPPDIEKWRVVLRNPQVCPDQVFVMVDLTEGNMTIWSRFKKLFRMLHPPVPPPNTAGSLSGRMGASLDPIPGEEGTRVILEARDDGDEPRLEKEEVPGEDAILNLPSDFQMGGSGRSSGSGSQVLKADVAAVEDAEGENMANLPVGGEVDPTYLELVSKSHFFLSLLPRDNLVDVASVSSSEENMIKIDLHRNQTQAFSDIASFEDMQKVMMGHEKYVLESLENKEAVPLAQKTASEEDTASCSTDGMEEMQRRRNQMLTLKPIYGEMSACLEKLTDPGKDMAAHKVPSDSTEKKLGMRNPPGTPENRYEAEEENEDWGIPVPLEIEKGEVEMTQEEEEMRKELENEIRRLSQNLGDEYIKTPTEMGSRVSLRPMTDGESATAILSNPIVQKLITTKIESPKRKFFSQVRVFNEFWNMAFPVCNQQGVKYWEVGLCDEDTAIEKAIFFWNELESRFDAKAKKIYETELREEDDEILESLMRWGDPFEEGDIRHRSNKEKNAEGNEDDSELDSEFDEDDDASEDDASDMSGAKKVERDELSSLESRPDLYWEANLRREAERCFGDFKFYCPVTYFDLHLLRKGFQRHACKYKDRLYFCSDENNQLRFITNPKQFLPKAGPPNPPPPRICITGSPGCMQEEIASQLSTEFKICYVSFRQRLHEIVKARFGHNVGPEFSNEIIPKAETDKELETSKKGDDLFFVPKSSGEPGENNLEEKEEGDEEEEEDESDEEEGLRIARSTPSTRIQKISSENIQPETSQTKMAIEDVALKSLGLLSQHNIETIPLNSIERTENLIERKWKKLTWMEVYIKAFLENGIQLPDEVLDEFILPLWKAKPFTEVGFILVGFPNTLEDVQYMVKRNCIPEYVFVMECKSVVIRNRLIVPAVDRYHRTKNPSGKKYRRLTERTQRAKDALDLRNIGIKQKPDTTGEIFPYQAEGRREVNEFEKETWSYTDELSIDIARALRYYHQIYSRGTEKMKKALNKERICWMPVDTNLGIHQGKHKVLEKASSILKYRSNVFEDTVRLSFASAQALIDRGVFSLSPLQRWCPVELSRGNTGINVWNAPGIKKIPYLHRRFIYFVGGEKNAKHFEENTWELTNQALLLQSVPMYCMILGKAKTGKTTLARSLANRLGLFYVSCLDAVEAVLAHAFVTEWASVLKEVNPALAASGHQEMHLANELLEYIRQGRAIPRFLVYRCLDLFLMDPKAQCNGIVFDDFPTIIDELIELNYREISPCLVLNLRIPITEAYVRCDQDRALELKSDTVPIESRDCIDHLWDHYGHVTSETFRWFTEEYQNIYKIDGTQNPEMVYKEAYEQLSHTQKKVQDYLENLYFGRPNTLEGTCPITSTLFHRLNQEFGFFCPVALNDYDELVSVRSVSNLSQVVEYKGEIFLFSSRAAAIKFLKNPRKYTAPGCFKTPPKELPRTLTVDPEDWERLKENWGFLDFDPVLYYANHHYKGLQRGDPQYCVVYRRKLYVFIDEENQKKFMKAPAKYWNLLLPMKIPKKAEPIDYEKITPYSYLSSKGMVPILKKVVKLMAEKRPRVPFMNVDQCAALYMGYYLKSMNMNSPYELRQKYRDAMFKMMTVKSTTREFLHELKNFYGCRPRNLPDRLKKQLEEFIQFEHYPVEEKVYMPRIPGHVLGYEHVKEPFTETQVARKVRRMMNNLKEVEIREKMEAFAGYSKKKKAAEEAAQRAAEDAREAALLAKKKMDKAQMRMKKTKSLQSKRTNSSREYSMSNTIDKESYKT